MGQLTGPLPASHLTLESTIQVDLSNETARLPLYPGIAYKGTPHQEKVWYILEDASDAGAAHDLGVNYAPKLANIGISCPACVQTVTLENPTPQQNPFGPATIDFAGAPDFSPHPDRGPGAGRIPAGQVRPRRGSWPRIQPVHQDRRVRHHLQRADRGHRRRPVRRDPPHQHRGPRAGYPHRRPLRARPVRRVLGGHAVRQGLRCRPADRVPVHRRGAAADRGAGAVHLRAALNDASCNGCDDFLGSARERLFGFINGQTGADNPQAQGFQHLAKDGMVGEDASLANTAFINALRYGGDLLNVFGDFPTLTDPRHSQAYSPLWDAQLGLWTPKAVAEGLNKRQIDENQVFNLAATQPDLLTGVNPATGQPEPYGSVGVDINCAVIGYTATAPTANLAPPAPGSQFPPR